MLFIFAPKLVVFIFSALSKQDRTVKKKSDVRNLKKPRINLLSHTWVMRTHIKVKWLLLPPFSPFSLRVGEKSILESRNSTKERGSFRKLPYSPTSSEHHQTFSWSTADIGTDTHRNHQVIHNHMKETSTVIVGCPKPVFKE